MNVLAITPIEMDLKIITTSQIFCWLNGVLLDILSQSWAVLGNLIRIILYDAECYGQIWQEVELRPDPCVINYIKYTDFFSQTAINICFSFFRAYQKFLMTWSNFIRLCGKFHRKPFLRWQLKEVLSLIKASLWTSTSLSLTMANSLVCTSTAGSRLVEEIKEDLLSAWDILELGQFYILATY